MASLFPLSPHSLPPKLKSQNAETKGWGEGDRGSGLGSLASALVRKGRPALSCLGSCVCFKSNNNGRGDCPTAQLPPYEPLGVCREKGDGNLRVRSKGGGLQGSALRGSLAKTPWVRGGGSPLGREKASPLGKARPLGGPPTVKRTVLPREPRDRRPAPRARRHGGAPALRGW